METWEDADRGSSDEGHDTVFSGSGKECNSFGDWEPSVDKDAQRVAIWLFAGDIEQQVDYGYVPEQYPARIFMNCAQCWESNFGVLQQGVFWAGDVHFEAVKKLDTGQKGGRGNRTLPRRRGEICAFDSVFGMWIVHVVYALICSADQYMR